MLRWALTYPRAMAVGVLGCVLAILAAVQVMGEVPEEPREVAPGDLRFVARSVEIARPLGSMPPPPPTLKARVPANPFRQLHNVGLAGYELRDSIKSLGVDMTAVAHFDLADIDVAAIDPDARKCMTQAIYYEARNQDLAGQMAVADVVLNRVDSTRYPDTVCGVVYEGSHRPTGCQFTFTCDGSLSRPIERRSMVQAQLLATAILGGFRVPLSGQATNYHAGYVSPYWAPTLDETRTVGDHIFYKRGDKFEQYLRKKAALKKTEARSVTSG